MDLSLRLLGDATGATDAFNKLGNQAQAVLQIVKQFAVESVKSFAEAEKVQKQLARAAGENTKAFEAQADAMSKQFAINDESIKQLQTLALTYGALPQQVGGAVEAVENWAAATGKDAKSAMLELIKAVELGKGSLDRGRIQFEATGDSARDMASAIDALNKKFGGAAAADADTLEGRARGAANAFNELEETFGGFIGAVEHKLGALSFLTDRLREMQELLTNEDLQRWLIGKAIGDSDEEIAKHMKGGDTPGITPGVGGPMMLNLPELPVSVKVKKPKDDWGWGPFGDPEKSFDGWEQEYNETKAKQAADILAHDFEIKSMEDKVHADELKDEEKHDEAMLKSKRLVAEQEIDVETEKQRKLDAELEKWEATEDRRFKQQEEKWRQAGDRMGAEFVNAIGAQLMRLAEGGEFDPAEMAGDIVSTLLTIGGFAIGTYLGAPQLGGALGGLAGGLAKTGIVAAAGRKRKHDGGIIERFHGGGWPGLGPDEVPIIAQQGENMWSRADVRGAGGPAAVESLKRGGARSTVINITAMDTQSLMDAFGRDAGRGLFDSIRVGRGDAPTLFTG